jgi:hypothetical protein
VAALRSDKQGCGRVTFLFFLFLGVGQLGLAALGSIVGIAVSSVPSLKSSRRALIRAAVYGCGSAYAGVVAGFFGVLAGGLGCKALQATGVDTTCVFVAEAAPWLLFGGYLVGLVEGGRLGWRHGASHHEDIDDRTVPGSGAAASMGESP